MVQKPTVIVFETIQNAEKAGSIQAKSKLIEAYDPNFDMKLNWYANSAVFVQKITDHQIAVSKAKSLYF